MAIAVADATCLQLVDDMLDFRSTSAAFGKPSGGADLRLGIATAPVLFAWQEAPAEARMGEMVRRKFGGEGDVPKVRSCRALRAHAAQADKRVTSRHWRWWRPRKDCNAPQSSRNITSIWPSMHWPSCRTRRQGTPWPSWREEC